MDLQFEWDFKKALKNQEKHGVRFEVVTRIFLDLNRIQWREERKDYGEQRYLSIGLIENREFVVVFTKRGEIIRIISARKANAREQRTYRQIRT